MGFISDFLKVLVLSLVEGITEFLPISSTGHLVLVNQFIRLEPASFANAFSVIIQLGAIFSVVVLYWHRINPWTKAKRPARKPRHYDDFNLQTKLHYNLTHGDPQTLRLWGKVLVACIPGGLVGFLLDDFIDAHLMSMAVVATTLLVYGLLIILVERWQMSRGEARFESVSEIPLKTAFLIGCFQCLALVPGTSRSAATILGAILLGCSRVAAAEFSFFLAIPVMVGATLLKVVKNLAGFSFYQWFLILIGLFLSFVVAYVVIKRFMTYIKRRSFIPFGYYRIALSVLLILYMIFARA